MNKRQAQNNVFLLAAVTAPLLHTASGSSWVSVAAVGAGSLAACWMVEVLTRENEMPRWLLLLRWLWSAVITAEFLSWTILAWTDEPWIPLILLALTVWTQIRGEGTADRSGILLGYFLLLLTAGILLSAIKEIEPGKLVPEWQMKNEGLIVAFLLPALQVHGTDWKTKGKVLSIGLILSIVTVGVLGTQYCWDAEEPFYEMSKSLTFFGVSKRFESLAAVAITIGLYLSALFVQSRSGVKKGENGKKLLTNVALSAIILITGMKFSDQILALGCVLIWVFLPAFVGAKKNLKKMKKTS